MKIEIDIRELIRRALILLAGSALCALILIGIFTDIGTHTLFRVSVAMDAEEVDVNDTAFLEYYDVKAKINDTDSYRMYLDENVYGSFDAALDFMKFVKQNTDVHLLCMDIADPEAVNAYLESGNPAGLSDAGITGLRAAFFQKLYSYNQNLPPKKRIVIVNEQPEARCFLLVQGAYDHSAASEGMFDVSMIYPAAENCDPLFNVDTMMLAGCRIRFGSVERLDGCVKILESASGNLGMPAFDGIHQPTFYFIIENEVKEGDV